MIEQRAVDHRSEHARTHGGYHLAESDRGFHFDIQFFEIGRIRVIRICGDGWVRPWWRGAPAVTDDADASDVRPDRFDHLEDPFHRPPPEPIVADVEHPIILRGKVERNLP